MLRLRLISTHTFDAPMPERTSPVGQGVPQLAPVHGVPPGPRSSIGDPPPQPMQNGTMAGAPVAESVTVTRPPTGEGGNPPPVSVTATSAGS